MDFVVEDGSAKADATSLVSLDELKSYWETVGYDYSEFDDDTLKAATNRASNVLNVQYMGMWPGWRRTRYQRFEWPRTGAFYIDGWPVQYNVVPQEVKHAVSELVYLDLKKRVDPQPVTSTKGEVQSESVSAGPVSRSVTYRGSVSGKPIMYPVRDALRRLIDMSSRLNVRRV